jgi:hypothetical protein
MAVVVFPHPPFWLAMAIVLMTEPFLSSSVLRELLDLTGLSSLYYCTRVYRNDGSSAPNLNTVMIGAQAGPDVDSLKG